MSLENPTDIEATRYAESYVIYGDQSKALRSAFPKSKMKPESIHQRASKFHSIVKVRSRIDELHKTINSDADDKALYTVSQALEELNTAMTFAKELETPAPIVSAIMGKAKIAGLLVDQVKTEDITPPKIEYVVPNEDQADHPAA